MNGKDLNPGRLHKTGGGPRGKGINCAEGRAALWVPPTSGKSLRTARHKKIPPQITKGKEVFMLSLLLGELFMFQCLTQHIS